MILDLGCGSNKYPGSVGVDLSPEADIHASATDLHGYVKDSSVDKVYSRRCLQHIRQHEKVFSEMYRVLRPGGSIEIIVASWRGWLYYQLKWLFTSKPYSYFHWYSQGELRRLAVTHGFSHVKICTLRTARSFGMDLCLTAEKEANT